LKGEKVIVLIEIEGNEDDHLERENINLAKVIDHHHLVLTLKTKND